MCVYTLRAPAAPARVSSPRAAGPGSTPPGPPSEAPPPEGPPPEDPPSRPAAAAHRLAETAGSQAVPSAGPAA